MTLARQVKILEKSSSRRLRLLSRSDATGSALVLSGLASALLAVVMLVLFVREQDRIDYYNDPYIARIIKDEKIRIAYTPDLTTEMRQSADLGDWKSFDGRLARALARELQKILHLKALRPEPVAGTWAETAVSIREGKADIIVSGFSYVPERETLYGLRFSAPYATTGFAVVSCRDLSDVQIPESRLVAQEITTSVQVARAIAGADRVTLIQTVAELLELARTTNGPLVVLDERSAKALVLQHPDLRYKPIREEDMPPSLPGYLIPQRYAIGVPVDAPRLLQEVNLALTRISIDDIERAVLDGEN